MDENRELLKRMTQRLLDYYDEFGLDDGIINEARGLLGVVHQLKNVACSKCAGTGYRAYGSTATWTGGIGGQAITDGVCDSCWGSGRSDKTFGDLRVLNRTKIAELEKPSDALLSQEILKLLSENEEPFTVEQIFNSLKNDLEIR